MIRILRPGGADSNDGRFAWYSARLTDCERPVCYTSEK